MRTSKTFIEKEEIIEWLLSGDVSIQYQTYRDLLDKKNGRLQNRIAQEGWGKKFLSFQNNNGHWGRGFYFPKWTSSHYTLLDLKNLGLPQNSLPIKKTLKLIFNKEMKPEEKYAAPSRTVSTDICINGMVLNYASYFKYPEKHLTSIVDYLLENQMIDGGYNCISPRSGAVHSSLHTTLSVLEGFYEYKKNDYTYRIKDIQSMEKDCLEFILQHKLFKSDKTMEIINKDFLKLSFPCRWRYDILRCLDYFQYAKLRYDPRIDDAIEVLLNKRRKDGLWNLQAKWPGEFHFEMEKPGKPSRWNTLRVMRVFNHFKIL
ncbi:MAG: hypothetical protein R3250_00890 [Melioribacteraceae bacterium]|nr:hypothetical protein [Melioribacteraceae bacterium]